MTLFQFRYYSSYFDWLFFSFRETNEHISRDLTHFYLNISIHLDSTYFCLFKIIFLAEFISLSKIDFNSEKDNVKVCTICQIQIINLQWERKRWLYGFWHCLLFQNCVYKGGPNDKGQSDPHSQALERSISLSHDIVKWFFLH